ncbi:STN domain-containing protein [Roseivirga sp.]|uniref:STN domain-containing protein n=1 Tax=Roseivirga sp. TaxID=1964215 RepID=UPI002B27C047|nr:STN domain-containing protein [Roseivirga sp.]
MFSKAFLICLFMPFALMVMGQGENDVLARKVTLNIRETSIEDILKQIETEDFAFTYSAEIFDVKKRISINVKDETIGNILEILFRGQGMECQQLGNKLLIRKKRIPKETVPKSDTIKKEITPTSPIKPSAQKVVPPVVEKEREETPVTDPKNETVTPILEAQSNDSAIGNSIPSSEASGSASENARAEYYQEERKQTEAIVAAYKNHELAPLIFVPLYDAHPRSLFPFKFKGEIATEEAPKREKEPKPEKPAKDKKFRMNLAPTVGYTEIGNRDAVLIGGQLVYNPTKNFGIGVAGKGFITRAEPDAQLGSDYAYSGGYGGLLLEATLFPDQPFHLSFPIVFGLGEVMYNSLQPVTGLNTIEDQRTIFVFEPGVYLEMNVIKYLRVGFGAAYRDASSTNLKYSSTEQPIMDKNGLDGLSINVMLKFGIF